MASFGGSSITSAVAFGTGNPANFEKGSSSSTNDLPEHNSDENGRGYFTNLLLRKSPPRTRPRRDEPTQREFRIEGERGQNYTVDIRSPQERCVLNQQCVTLSFPAPPSRPLGVIVNTSSSNGHVDINVTMTNNEPQSVRPQPTTTRNNVQAPTRGPIDINEPPARTLQFEFGGRSIDATPVELVPAPQWTPTVGTVQAYLRSMPDNYNPLGAGPSNYQEINHAHGCIVGPRTLHPGESLQLRRNEATNQWDQELISHQAHNDFDECYCKACWKGPLPPHVAEYGIFDDDEPHQEEANNINRGANGDDEEAADDMDADDGGVTDEDFRPEVIQFLAAIALERLSEHIEASSAMEEDEDELDEPEGIPIELIPQALRKEQYSPFFAALTSRTDRNCSICFEEFRAAKENGVLKCKHEFHYDCIETWLKNNNSCPLCRAVALADGEYLTLTN